MSPRCKDAVRARRARRLSAGAWQAGALVVAALAASLDPELARAEQAGGDAGGAIPDGSQLDVPGAGVEAWPRPDALDAGRADAAVPGELRALAGHLVLERAGDLVRVTEMYVLDARSAEPARPGEPWVRLPEGARQIEVSEGEPFVRPAGSGIELARTIEPGRRSVAFGFQLDAAGGEARIVHTLPFAVERLHLVWPADAPLEARAMGFADAGTVEIRGRSMRVLERRTEVAAGEPIAVLTTGSRAPARSEAEPLVRDPLSSVRPLTLALAVLTLLAGLLLPRGLRLPVSRGPRDRAAP